MITRSIESLLFREGANISWFSVAVFPEFVFYILVVIFLILKLTRKPTRYFVWVSLLIFIPCYAFCILIDVGKGNRYAPYRTDFHGADLCVSRAHPILYFCDTYRLPHWMDGGELTDQVHLFSLTDQSVAFRVTMDLEYGDFDNENRDYIVVDRHSGKFNALQLYGGKEWKGVVTEITSNAEYKQTDEWLQKKLKKKIGVDYDNWVRDRISEERAVLKNLEK